MEHNQDMLKILTQLEQSGRRQVRYARIQCVFSVIAAVCCAVILVTVLGVMPQVQALTEQTKDLLGQAQHLAAQIEDVAGDAQSLAAKTETVLNNLETVSGELAEADLGGMVDNVDTLVSSSQAALKQATDKLNAMDIATLNKAIADLADVVEPLAKFFKNFR